MYSGVLIFFSRKYYFNLNFKRNIGVIYETTINVLLNGALVVFFFHLD